jgi:hypothetical protein
MDRAAPLRRAERLFNMDQMTQSSRPNLDCPTSGEPGSRLEAGQAEAWVVKTGGRDHAFLAEIPRDSTPMNRATCSTE